MILVVNSSICCRLILYFEYKSHLRHIFEHKEVDSKTKVIMWSNLGLKGIFLCNCLGSSVNSPPGPAFHFDKGDIVRGRLELSWPLMANHHYQSLSCPVFFVVAGLSHWSYHFFCLLSKVRWAKDIYHKHFTLSSSECSVKRLEQWELFKKVRPCLTIWYALHLLFSQHRLEFKGSLMWLERHCERSTALWLPFGGKTLRNHLLPK